MPDPKKDKKEPKKDPREPGQVETEQRTNYILAEKPEEEIKDVEQSLRVDFTDEEEQKFFKDITEELDEIEDKLTPYRKEFGINDDQYDCILPPKDFPFADSSNTATPMTPEKVDGAVARADKVMFIEPVWIVEPTEESDLETAEHQENFLDYMARNVMDYPEAKGAANHDSFLHGTGMIEIVWSYETERIKDVEEYKGNEKGIRDIKKNYPEIEKEYPELLRKLENGKKVELLVEYDDPAYNAPKAIHVPLEKFVIDPEVLDIKKAHLCGKEFEMTGNDIAKLHADGYYEDIEGIKWEFGENEGVEKDDDYLKKTYKCYKLIYHYKLKEDDDLESRLVVEMVYDKEQNRKTLLKVIQFPYWHNRVFWIPGYITKRKKGFFRDGFARKLRSTQESSDILFNINVDAAMVGLIPSFKANANKKMEIGAQLARGHYPGITYYLDDPARDLIEVQHNVGNLGHLNLLYAQNYKNGDLMSGVTGYQTGQESPTDPNAPARKVGMLLAEANIRIGQYISELQKSNKEAAYQIIQLEYQFRPEGRTYRTMDKKHEKIFPKMTRKEVRLRADYIPHGSADVLLRQNEKQDIMSFIDIMTKNERLNTLLGNQELRYLVENLVKSWGSDFDKKVNRIVQSPEELQEYEVQVTQQAMAQFLGVQAPYGKEQEVLVAALQLAAQGMPRQQISQILQQQFPITKEMESVKSSEDKKQVKEEMGVE